MFKTDTTISMPLYVPAARKVSIPPMENSTVQNNAQINTPKKRYPLSQCLVDEGFMTQQELDYANFKAGFRSEVPKPQAQTVFFGLYEHIHQIKP